MRKLINIIACAVFLIAIMGCATTGTGVQTGGTFTVTTDRTQPLFPVNFTFGITHTQYWWFVSNKVAVNRVEGLLKSVASIQAVPIMGWGSKNPWTSKTAAFDFSDIKARVDVAAEMGAQPWITLCSAPGWMKDSGSDWDMETAPSAEHEDDFAYLCAQVAKAFPQVPVFQVWNEFKGMWADGGQVDFERYTRVYNKVYAAVKAVRPDAKIGGPYLVLEGDGTRETFGGFEDSRHTSVPLNNLSKEAIQYFLANASGVDYFLVDRANVDYHNDGYWPWQTGLWRPTRDQAMKLTKYFQKATRELTDMTDLPIVWSEYYGTFGDGKGEFRKLNQPYIGAHYASIMYNMIMGSGGRDLYALLWLEREADIRHALFTDLDSAAGGQPTPHYFALKKMLDTFPKGTMLYTAEISSPDMEKDKISDTLEVMASDAAVLAINKTNTRFTVIIDGASYELEPYAVEVLNY